MSRIAVFIGVPLALVTPRAFGAESLTAAESKASSPKRDALTVSFEQLASFPYAPPEKPTEKKPEIPATVRALDQKKVAITGFLVPVDMQNGMMKKAVLLRNQMSCCYGVPPNFNEYVLVTIKGEGVRAIMDVPVTVTGTLKIGETYEDGYFVGLYQLDGEQLAETPRE